MAGDDAKQNATSAKPSPLRRNVFLGAFALILTVYAVYSVQQGEFLLPYKLSPHSRFQHLDFSGAALWLLAVGVWVLALGLVIAIFENPAVTDGVAPAGKGKGLPAPLTGFLYVFLGTDVYKLRGRQALSIWVSFCGVAIAGAAFLLRLTGLL